MRLVLQRVTSASVSVDGEVIGSIGVGLLALVGVGLDDTPVTAMAAAEKMSQLRVFADEAGKMNRSVLEVGGAVLVVSQFTLLGDISRGRRPSFVKAAPGAAAEPLVAAVAAELQVMGLPVSGGRFGADMQVSSVNDGPVTLVLDL